MLRSIARYLLFASGSLMLLGALLSGAASLMALADRMKHGRGILFADAEFLAMAAAALGVPGALLIWLGVRFSKR